MAKIISKTVDELISEHWEQELQHSRNKRKELLKALDTYNANRMGSFREVPPSPEEEQQVRDWYFKILELNYEAIFTKEEIPETILYFLSDDYFKDQ